MAIAGGAAGLPTGSIDRNDWGTKPMVSAFGKSTDRPLLEVTSRIELRISLKNMETVLSEHTELLHALLCYTAVNRMCFPELMRWKILKPRMKK